MNNNDKLKILAEHIDAQAKIAKQEKAKHLKLVKKTKPLLIKACKDFLKQHPGIASIYWHQFTPSYADGDIPTFQGGLQFGDIYLNFTNEAGLRKYADTTDLFDQSTYYESYDCSKYGQKIIQQFAMIILSVIEDEDLKIFGASHKIYFSSSDHWTEEYYE